ncbi:MAG: hypothetical protein V1813_00360 [Candidatus Aenigmatarchaeota archaeon]
MRRTCLIAALSLFFLFPLVQAADICEIGSTLPQYPSFNSSMLLVIPTTEVDFRLDTFSAPVRIGYDIRDAYFNLVQPWSWGGMQKFSDCYVCEFSGSPTFDASCGPTPFTYGGNYNITFSANDFNDYTEFNRKVLIFPERFTGVIIHIGSDMTVHVAATAPVETTEVRVTIYDASTGLKIEGAGGNMNATVYGGSYTMDIEGLREGTYYADFVFVKPGDIRGGALYKFNISPVSEFTIATDKSSYWIGETVEVSGVSMCSKVKGSVVTPVSTIIIPEKAVSDGKYDFEFYIDKTYPKGNYTVKAECGTNKVEKLVDVKELFTLSKTAHTFTFTDATTRLSENITVKNMINGSITLSTSTDLTGFLTPTLAKTGLGPFPTSTTLTLTANPTGLPLTGKSGKVTVSTSDGAAISIDVSLISNVACPQCPPASASPIEISPSLWEETDCVSGETLNETFTISNGGTSALTGFTASSSEFDTAEPSFPEQIAAGGTGDAEISIGATEGFNSGYIEISSGGKTAKVYVVTSCSADNSADVATLRSEFDALSESFREAGFSEDAVTEMMYGVEYDLSDAESSAGSGSYSVAAESLARAQAGYDALSSAYESIGTGGSGDNGMLVILLAVAFVAVLGLFLYQNFGAKLLKRRSAEGGDGGGKEKDEELF